MTHINRTVSVPYSANALYNLVLDVNSYPEFLPWCGGARVEEQSAGVQVATVKIAKGPLNTEFTTRNLLTEDREIKVSLVRGPFKRLEGVWRFQPLPDTGCKVELDMRFDFSAGPLGMLLKPVFTALCDSLLGSFVDRAKLLHANK